MFLGEIFQIQTQTINGSPDPIRVTKNWPDLSHKKFTQPGSKIFDPDPSQVIFDLNKVNLRCVFHIMGQ